MTLFTNGRFLRFLITPPLLPRFRRSLQTRKSLSTRLYTTPSSRNELSMPTKSSSTPLPEQMELKLSLTFTCTVFDCGERSTHKFTKRAYQKGVILVQCPGCKNMHVCYHLYRKKIFRNNLDLFPPRNSQSKCDCDAIGCNR